MDNTITIVPFHLIGHGVPYWHACAPTLTQYEGFIHNLKQNIEKEHRSYIMSCANDTPPMPPYGYLMRTYMLNGLTFSKIQNILQLPKRPNYSNLNMVNTWVILANKKYQTMLYLSFELCAP